LNKFERRHRFSVSQEQVVAATMPAE